MIDMSSCDLHVSDVTVDGENIGATNLRMPCGAAPFQWAAVAQMQRVMTKEGNLSGMPQSHQVVWTQ